MSRFFDLSWSDLSFDKQQDMVNEITPEVLAHWEEEGKQYMNNDWHVAPKTWQEAYCRMANFDYILWNDLDENSEEFQNFDWEGTIKMQAEEVAEKVCQNAVRMLELKVEIGVV